jgi:hypothetical protein
VANLSKIFLYNINGTLQKINQLKNQLLIMGTILGQLGSNSGSFPQQMPTDHF